MISRFFIDHPVFANVIAVVTILFGVVALNRLPVERYPAITPPTVIVSTSYPGANAKVVADTVAAPIEQQVNGVENMMYMSSTSSGDGSYQLTITFEIGTNLDNAQVLVQNRLAVAEPQLPEEVRRQGVTVKKQSANIILAISLTSPPPKDRYDLILDPTALADLHVSESDVRQALAGQGAGMDTAVAGKPSRYRITADDSFATDGPAGADKLRDVQIKRGDGPPVRLSDVGKVTNLPGAYDGLFLTNYATLRLRDDLSRVNGVGDVMVRGVGAYAMRIWLDPDKLAARQLTTQDVAAALTRQNVQVAAGQVGQPPNPSGQTFQMTVTTLGRLTDPAEFEGIIVKSGGAGQIVYLRDVARVELGAQSYDTFNSRNGFEAANVLIFQLPGSNALEVAKGVREAMERIKPSLPPGVDYNVPFDTTKFVEAAIDSVYWTLFEAAALVLIVILIFLQSWRALLVPATTVPVTIIGAFAFMPALGFSVNLLTLFGLVLAIGIVVDDAIVIVENASHHIERGMSPRDATIQAMSEVTGPVISITLVLMAVFIPTAFLGGITGQLYRQFALTIAATAFISAVNALTLKPAQCATFLRPHTGRNFFTRIFDTVYKPVERGYAWCVRHSLRVWWLVLLVFFGIAGFAVWWYLKTPTGFLPEEDQGYVLIAVQLPDAASLERTLEVTERMNKVFRKFKDNGTVDNWFVLGGMSLLDGTNAPNGATAFAAWSDWSQRTKPGTQQDDLVKALQIEFAQMQDAFIIVIVPPAIQGLGFAGGFQMQLEDRGGAGLSALQERATALMEAAKKRPEFDPQKFTSTFRAGVPQVYLNIDRVKAEKMGVKLDDVFGALQANLGSVYVNDFNKFDRTYQVRIQADAQFRADPNLLGRLEVKNRDGGRVPLGTLLTPETQIGPLSVIRYNLYPAAAINGTAPPGASSGDALQAMEQVAKETLPPTLGFEWTSIAYQEKRVSSGAFKILGMELSEAILIYLMAIVFVYLVLAAQYESWFLPLAVILVVPLGLLGVVAGVNIRHFVNNVYTQIGTVLIIALATKNAILIVEFARELRIQGKSIREAAVQAAQMRFRPIIMTSFAFILGMLPLVFATGAGAASRQSLGTAVFGGMITATVLAVFFVPIFYVAVQKLIELINGPPKFEATTFGGGVHANEQVGHNGVAGAGPHMEPAPTTGGP
jgi:hydrophobic/amphiphilic exporter-1 (mainly G- bacteria), HAE1 family